MRLLVRVAAKGAALISTTEPATAHLIAAQASRRNEERTGATGPKRPDRFTACITTQQAGAAPALYAPIMAPPSPAAQRNRFGGRDVSIASVGLWLCGDVDFIGASFGPAHFPRQTETLLSTAAARRAAVGLQKAALVEAGRCLADALGTEGHTTNRTFPVYPYDLGGRVWAGVNEELGAKFSSSVPVAHGAMGAGMAGSKTSGSMERASR